MRVSGVTFCAHSRPNTLKYTCIQLSKRIRPGKLLSPSLTTRVRRFQRPQAAEQDEKCFDTARGARCDHTAGQDVAVGGPAGPVTQRPLLSSSGGRPSPLSKCCGIRTVKGSGNLVPRCRGVGRAPLSSRTSAPQLPCCPIPPRAPTPSLALPFSPPSAAAQPPHPWQWQRPRATPQASRPPR
jgi:hypothetical protein